MPDGRNRFQRDQPTFEALPLFADHAFGACRFSLPLFGIACGDLLQIVDVVEVGVVEFVHVGGDVARHSDVDQEDRPVTARMQRGLDAPLVEDGLLPRNAGQHDVRLGQECVELVEPVCARAKAQGQILGVRARAVRDAHVLQALAGQRVQRQLDHLAGADQKRRLVLEVFEDLTRQIDGHACHRNGSLGDGGFIANPLGRRKGALKQSREHRPAASAFDRRAIGVLHLPENLRLADDHRVDRRSDAHHVPDRVTAFVFVEVLVEPAAFGQRHIARQLVGEEVIQTMAGGIDAMRGDDQIDAIAGRDHDGFFDLFASDQLLERRSRRFDCITLPNRERCAVVTHAEQQDLHASSSTPTTANNRKAKPPTALAAACRPTCRPRKRAATRPA